MRVALHAEASRLARMRREEPAKSQDERGTREVVLEGESSTDSGAIGESLHEALFPRPIGELFAATVAVAEHTGKGVRIKLIAADAILALVPWEFLRARRRNPVCLSEATPVVRYVQVPRPSATMRVEGPLRILGVLSADDAKALDLNGERSSIGSELASLEKAGCVEIEWLESPTGNDLLDAIGRKDWHVLHFAGHGSFDTSLSEGVLSMASEGGGTRWLRASELRGLLQDKPSIRMVFLNSCDGAVGHVRDLLSSTAALVSDAGIPAVVAMQFPISDVVATAFARYVYRHLARGDSVESAVTKARKAIHINGSIEWATPALFMRAADGVIFDPAIPGRHVGRPPEGALERREVRPERLAGMEVVAHWMTRERAESAFGERERVHEEEHNRGADELEERKPSANEASAARERAPIGLEADSLQKRLEAKVSTFDNGNWAGAHESEAENFAQAKPAAGRISNVLPPTQAASFSQTQAGGSSLFADAPAWKQIGAVDLMQSGDTLALSDLPSRQPTQATGEPSNESAGESGAALIFQQSNVASIGASAWGISPPYYPLRPRRLRTLVLALCGGMGIGLLFSSIILHLNRARTDGVTTPMAIPDNDSSAVTVERARVATRTDPAEALRLLATLPEASPRRGSPEVAELVGQAADAILREAAKDPDPSRRDATIGPLLSNPLVSAARRHQANDLLRPIETSAPTAPAPPTKAIQSTVAAPRTARTPARRESENIAKPARADESDGDDKAIDPSQAVEEKKRQIIKDALVSRMKSGEATLDELRKLENMCLQEHDYHYREMAQVAIRKKAASSSPRLPEMRRKPEQIALPRLDPSVFCSGGASDRSTYEELLDAPAPRVAMEADRPFGGELYVSAELLEAQQQSVWAARA